jgi:hypothetical protein
MRKVFYIIIAVVLLAGCTTAIKPDDCPIRALKLTGDEAAAVAILKAAFTAQEAHRERFGRFGAYDKLKKEKLTDIEFTSEGVHKRIPMPSNECGVGDEGTVTGGRIHGYAFEFVVWGKGKKWRCLARPQNEEDKDRRCFYIDHTGVIRRVSFPLPHPLM